MNASLRSRAELFAEGQVISVEYPGIGSAGICRAAMNLILAVHVDGLHSTPTLEEAVQDDLPPIYEVFFSAAARAGNRDAFNYLRRVSGMVHCFEMPEMVLGEIDASFRENQEYSDVIWMAAAVYRFGSREVNWILGHYEGGPQEEDAGTEYESSDEMGDLTDEELDEILGPVTPETQ